jgi:hypothetical protein
MNRLVRGRAWQIFGGGRRGQCSIVVLMLEIQTVK